MNENPTQPKLSIIIPVYNEEEFLPEVMRRVRALAWENKEIILVNDCSTDQTHKILADENLFQNTIVLTHDKNMGKGAAIRTGLIEATGDIVIVQDADLEYNPEEILPVIEPIVRGDVLVSYGSRFMGSVKAMRLQNRVANWVLAKTVSWMFFCRITDEATAYKAFHRTVIERIPLKCYGFEFCPEVTAKILKLGYTIHEVPVNFTARTIAEGKKIGWKDFFIAMWTLISVRLFWNTKHAKPAVIERINTIHHDK